MMSRGNMKKWFVLIALVFVMVVWGEVLGVKSASAAPLAKVRTVRLMQSNEPEHLRFMERLGFSHVTIFVNVMEPLIDVGKKGEPVPKLATKWEHSADLTKWRFYLRRGVKFHNGANFTASDVVESAKWLIDVKEISRSYNSLPITEVVAVDDYTVDFRFKNSQPLMLINLRYLGIYPATMARNNRREVELRPIGTGPYKFAGWAMGQSIKLDRFEGYWGPKPSIDRAEITWRSESAIRLSALLAGEVDWIIDLSPEQASLPPKAISLPGGENYHLRLDESVQKDWTGVDPVLADKRLRLAIDYAINRKDLVALFKGFAMPLQGQFGKPGDFGYNENLKHRPNDLEKARALVKEANAVGKTLSFVAVSGRYSKDREVGEAVAQWIEQTGLKLKINFIPGEETTKWHVTKGEFRQYMSDIFLTSGDTLLEVESRYSRFLHKNGVQYALNDPEASRVFEESVAETNISKRAEGVAKAWAYSYEQAHFIPLIMPSAIWGLAKNLEWNQDLIGRPFISDMRFTD